MRLKSLLVVIAVCLLASAPTFAQNLLSNGSFETGDFTGWTTGGNFEDTIVTSGAFYDYTGAQDGTYYAALGPVGSPGTLSQTFADNNGQQYNFSFYLAAVGDSSSTFTAAWDGNQVLSLTNPTTTNGNWQLYSFSETGTGSDSITLGFQDDPGYIALDNISVSPASTTTTGGTTPEPSSLLLLGTGAIGLAGFVRRKITK